MCFGSVKPDYADGNIIIDINKEKNRDDLKNKIINWNDIDINIYEAAKNISLEDLNKLYLYLYAYFYFLHFLLLIPL